MKVNRPSHWAEGERAVAVDPPLSSRVPERWSGRLNFYTGRTLTHTALNLEQRHRSGRLNLLGRQLSPGVVTGLELTPGTDSAGAATLALSPGLGIAADGEDVSLARPLQVRLDDLPVVGRDPTLTDPPRGVGVVLLQPVVGESAGLEPSDDPCEIDPTNDAFADWQLLDGCRLAWFPWPAEWFLPLPGPRFRNDLAYRVFWREEAVGALPWDGFGVPLAILQVDSGGAVAFLDRYAVVRQGGSTTSRRRLAGSGPNPYLQQARLLQFSDHLRDLLAAGTPLPDAFGSFRYLPPVGLLPAEAVELAEASADFLPSAYEVTAAPVPREQLEVALDAAAGLTPYDLFVEDRIRVLVPVPQALYEPRLLVRETVDPLFAQTIAEFLAALNLALGARNQYRAMAPLVQGAIDASQVTQFPETDPERVPGEEPSPDAVVTPHAAEALQELRELHGLLTTRYPLTAEEAAQVDPDQLGTEAFAGVEPLIRDLEEKIRKADDRIDFGFLRLQTDIYRVRQLMLGSVEATRLATSPALAGIAQGVTNYATQQNIQAYFEAAGGGTAPRSEPTAAAGTGETPTGASMSFRSLRMAPAEEAAPRFMSMAGTSADVMASAKAAEPLVAAPKTDRTPETADVTLQSPIVGEVRLFRSATVAERIAEPPAPEAKSYAVATKAEVLGQLVDFPLNVAGVTVPVAGNERAVLTSDEFAKWVEESTFSDAEETVLQGRTQTVGPTVTVYLGPLTPAERKALGDRVENFRQALNRLLGRNQRDLAGADFSGLVLAGLFDPDPTDGDEAAFLSVGVNALEVTAAALRRVEGRIDRYRKAVAACRETLESLQDIAKEWNGSLAAADEEVAEGRHDVTVARALRAEEQVRVNAINRRRQEVLREHVEFLVFTRPRTATAVRGDIPSTLLYGVYEDPVPACLAEARDAPAELEEMLQVFREVPLRWLPHARPLVLQLDRPEVLRGVFRLAVEQAQSRLLQPIEVLPLAQAAAVPTGRAAKAADGVKRMLTAYRSAGTEFRKTRAALDLSFLDRSSWKQLGERAQDDLSLQDLVESGRGRSVLAQRAARELEHVEAVAACLYTRFGDVPAVVRLGWVDELSQFDEPVDLRQLDRLEGWDMLERELRLDLQRLADWLHTRVDAGIPDAVTLANDLVRVCLLLACHAPVSTIIDAHLPKPVSGRVGDILDLVLDRGLVRVGMRVGVYSGAEVAVQGVVEDLAQDSVRMRVTESVQTSFVLPAGAKAKFF